MRAELGEEQRFAVEGGRVSGLDGRTYQRRSTRLGRKQAAALVDAGAAVVTWSWPDLPVWHDGDDARAEWAELRRRVTVDSPDARPGHEPITAGRWESATDDALLLVLEHHH